MYESTPQHIIDEESAPGPVAAWMDSSTDDSSSSSSDSDGSNGSNTTAKRLRRMIPGRRRRKSSFGSKETAEAIDATRTPSIGTSSISPIPTDQISEEPVNFGHRFGAIDVAEDGDDEHPRRSRKNSVHTMSKKEKKRERKRQEKNRKKARRNGDDTIAESADASNEKALQDLDAPRRIDFAVVEPQSELEPQSDASKRPSALRNITTSIRPRIPASVGPNPANTGAAARTANPHDKP